MVAIRGGRPAAARRRSPRGNLSAPLAPETTGPERTPAPGADQPAVCYSQERRKAQGRRMPFAGKRRARIVFVLCCAAALPVAQAFQFFGGGRRGMRGDTRAYDYERRPAEFSFARYAYGSGYYGGWGRGRGSWDTDFPDAEYHLTQGIKRLTAIDAVHGGRVFAPLDDEIFDYPWLYAVEVGHWYLSEEEAERLREYLLRGGFLMLDDFHGSEEWATFLASMQRVFPDRPIVEIAEDDPILHTLYDLDQRTQIPGIRLLWSGRTYERDGYTPHWRGIYDDEERLMVAINFNMDMGDAWEHADWPEYPENLTALAYRFAINYVIYAMTH